jgi:uroporphyrinogen decarboxylase
MDMNDPTTFIDGEEREQVGMKTMNHRERTLAVLRYQPYDRLPIVHFGFLRETLQKWVEEGYLTAADVQGQEDGNEVDRRLAAKLGFDFNWQTMFYTNGGLDPVFESKVVKEFPDGLRHVRDADGVTVVQCAGTASISAEIDHLLKDRASWEEHYKWRYQWSEKRVDRALLDQLKSVKRERPLGLHCGSLFGHIRSVLGIVGVSYLYVDDEPLYREIIDTVADTCYRNVELTLKLGAGVGFDFAHFWEDICFKNGPLVNPDVFREYVGPHYKRITDLVKRHGIDIVSLDCDGWIDALIPVWFENGVNTMFPIEVGTWDASIAPWRKQYGRELRGVGGMNKVVFAHDKAAVDAEIERLRPLIDLGGYIPCPDHRLASDAKFENVCYFTERMRKIYG